ncbi:MAG: hypothetical protein KDD29_06945, partial [Flavobacteriales bacterium]|nr:hypothetical protein [Flavobacteriales bacterium]
MNKRVLILFCITLIGSCLFGQTNDNSLTEEKVKYQYDKDKSAEHYTPKINIGEEIQVNFDCCFDNDTVEIYINDSLTETVVFTTDESTSYADSRIYKFDKNKKETKLKLVLPNKKVYCEIILDKKYSILHVNRMEHWNKTWWITFRNFGIIYE